MASISPRTTASRRVFGETPTTDAALEHLGAKGTETLGLLPKIGTRERR